MKILPRLRGKKDLTNRMVGIQQGDIREKEKFIEEYLPFIIKTISVITNRYVEIENSEELSIGLEAFNEAIDKYNEDRGSFISFAQLVIKSRIMDYMRSISKKPIDFPIEDNQILQEPCFTERIFLQEEICLFEKRLLQFGIEFEDLVSDAPKHMDTRQRGIKIAKHIANDKEITDELFKKKTLPISKIATRYHVTPKMIKGSRKFIIAVILILRSEMDVLKQYIKEVERGEIGDA